MEQAKGSFEVKGTPLEPDVYTRDLVAELPVLRKLAEIETKILYNLDSADFQPHHWVELAACVHGSLDRYDGFVIVHGTVIKDDGRVYGGHYYVVSKIENGKAYLNDPAYPSGPRVISAALLDKSINTRGTHAMISIGR